MAFNILSFSSVVSSKETLEYMRDQGLLRSEYQCCGHNCSLVKDASLSDGEIFKCHSCKKRYSIRSDSFFSKSKLKLVVLFTMLFCFIRKLSVTQTLTLLGNEIREKAVFQWFTYFQEICSLYMTQEPEIILGNNI